MESLRIIADICNVIGFLLLFSSDPFQKLIDYQRKRIDQYSFHGSPKYWSDNRWKWENIYKKPAAYLFLLIGNILILFT